VAGINVISLENLLNPNDKNSKSIKDTINDSYSEEFYKVIDARFIIKDIEKAILKRYKNYKFIQRDLQIFEEFAITNITYRELACKYGVSKQAIHQILQRFKYRLKNSTSLKRMQEEEKEL